MFAYIWPTEKEIKGNRMREKWLKKETWIRFVKIIMIAMIIEIFVFNYRSVVTIFNKPIDAFSNCDIAVEDIHIDENGNMYIAGEQPTIYIDNIHKKVTEIKMQVSMPDSEEVPYMVSGVMGVTVYSRYEDTLSYYMNKSHNVVKDVERSEYISLFSTRGLNSLGLELELSNGSYFYIEELVLNPRVPFHFNFVRILVLFLVCSLGFAYRRNSNLWNIKVSEENSIGEWMMLGFLIILIAATGSIMFSNKAIGTTDSYTPYERLAEALSEGRVYLLPEPTEELEAIENPYDPFARKELENYLFDTAYYNGHYYVYSGVVPCILYYVPLKLLTGLSMPTTLVMEWNIILFAVGLYFLLRSLIRKYVPQTSLPMFMLLYAVTVCGCQILYYANQPDDYMIPIICATVFTVWGLYFWISSIRDEENRKLCILRLVLGSLLMALVAGCRPQLLIYSLLAFVIFKDFFKADAEKGYSAKKRWGTIFLALIPYVLVAIPLMWYNYIRFGSPFEFGPNYNLSSYDFSLVKFGIDEIGVGLYNFLFQLPNLYNDFPFINLGSRFSELLGFTGIYRETLPGGLIVTNWILLFILGIRYIKEKKKLYHINLVMLGLSLLALVLDAERAGIVYRYMLDFSFGFFLVASCVIAGLEGKIELVSGEKSTALHIFRMVVIALGVASLVYNFLLLVIWGTKYPLIYGNTNLYYKIYYNIRFWT